MDMGNEKPGKLSCLATIIRKESLQKEMEMMQYFLLHLIFLQLTGKSETELQLVALKITTKTRTNSFSLIHLIQQRHH